MFKKCLSAFLSLLFVFTVLITPVQSISAFTELPVSLKDVSYKFNSTVKFLDLSTLTKTGDNINIPNTSFSSGDIIVDKKNSISIKILKVNNDGSYLTVKPSMNDLFKEFNIPRQIIQPNSANINEYQVKGVSIEDYLKNKNPDRSGQKSSKKYAGSSDVMDNINKLFSERNSKVYQYNGVYEFSALGSSSNKVKLSLDGALGVSPNLVAEYSLSDGYEFGFVDAAQFIDVNMMFDVKINDEMYLPVFSVYVPIPGIGSVKLGIFMVVDVDGNITLTVKAQEGIIANASVYGSTSFGIPTSFHVNKSFDQYFGAECDPMGSIKAGLYLTPLVSLEILDVDVFDAQLRLGFYGYSNISNQTMNYGVNFVINAFVTVLDDRTTLINEHIPIIERNKSFNPADDVIFYFSRFCSYQNRINIAAMTKRLSGSNIANAPPFSDKLPFSNRTLEIWYYKAGNNPQNGANQSPTYKIPVQTDSNGCIGINFSVLAGYSIDVQKGDCIIVKAPGFIGETDILQSVSPFGKEKLPGQGDFYGYSRVYGDFFEDTIQFNTLSGPDLTALDIPNTGKIEFEPKKRIYYNGPVKLYSTDKTTGVTETSVFNANENQNIYYTNSIMSSLSSSIFQNHYNIKPNNELRWQINFDNYIYGTYEPTGAGGHQTTHQVTIKRLVEDKQVVIEDYYGVPIGLQHNIALRLIAVNKGGTKPYIGPAKLDITLGKVPPEYIQSFEIDKAIADLGYIKFPAADIRYPNHYEYYTEPPFPVVLYASSAPYSMTLDPKYNLSVNNFDASKGAVSQAHYYWRWEELQPDIPETVSIKKKRTIYHEDSPPTTSTITVNVDNKKFFFPDNISVPEFSSIPVSYTVYDPMAGKSFSTPDLNDYSLDPSRNIYQMRHLVYGLAIEGQPINNPSFSPPNPTVKGDNGLVEYDFSKFNVLEYLDTLKNHSNQFVINPLTEGSELYITMPSVEKNNALKTSLKINNYSYLPTWATGYISSIVNNKIMSLDSKGNFSAGKNTTRAEFSSAIVNTLGLSSLDIEKSGFPFNDIKKDDKNINGMIIAYQCGIINGTSATTFSPSELITRQDAATMLMRAFNLRNKSLVPNNTSGRLNAFSDKANVSSYSTASLEQAISLDFFSGYPDNTLLPQNNILNEQTAKILYQLKIKAEKPGLQWVK